MGTMSDVLVALVLSLAPLTGYVLGRFAKEELAPGRRWFTLAQHVLFVATMFVFAYAHKLQFVHAGVGLALIFAYLAFKQFRIWWLVQTVFGAAFSLTSQQFFLGSLIFLHGLPTGSLAKKPKDALLAGAIFLVVSVAVMRLL